MRGFRKTLAGLLPFALHKKYAFPIVTSNGKTVLAYASITAKPPHTVEVALKRCCIHAIIVSIAHETLHAQGLLEKDGPLELATATVSRGSPSREVAYALLSSLLNLPMYCSTHR